MLSLIPYSRYRKIARMRYSEDATLEDIAQTQFVTRERVRQMLVKAGQKVASKLQQRSHARPRRSHEPEAD